MWSAMAPSSFSRTAPTTQWTTALDQEGLAGVSCHQYQNTPHRVELRQGDDVTTLEGAGITLNVLGPVCDDGWNAFQAGVVLCQLGYDYGHEHFSSHWGNEPSN